jgi:hypothetical protein
MTRPMEKYLSGKQVRFEYTGIGVDRQLAFLEIVP